MSLVLFFAMSVPAGLALFHLWRATEGASSVARLLRLAPTPLRDIAEGPVEVEGTIAALDAPLVAPSGRAGVFVDVGVRATRGAGKNARVVHESHARREVTAAITSADGTSVRLDFDFIEVVGAPASFVVAMSDIEAPTREWAADAVVDADTLTFRERIVEPGARVVVTGQASVVDAVVDPRGSGYRDGVPVEKKTFVIGGSLDANLLVATGTARQLLWRATWPVVVLVLTALAGLGYAGLVLMLLLA